MFKLSRSEERIYNAMIQRGDDKPVVWTVEEIAKENWRDKPRPKSWHSVIVHTMLSIRLRTAPLGNNRVVLCSKPGGRGNKALYAIERKARMKGLPYQ